MRQSVRLPHQALPDLGKSWSTNAQLTADSMNNSLFSSSLSPPSSLATLFPTHTYLVLDVLSNEFVPNARFEVEPHGLLLLLLLLALVVLLVIVRHGFGGAVFVVV